MPANDISDPQSDYYRSYAAYYAATLQRVAAVIAAVGDTRDLEPMERAAVCKTALTRIAFLAESTPSTLDLKLAGQT